MGFVDEPLVDDPELMSEEAAPFLDFLADFFIFFFEVCFFMVPFESFLVVVDESLEVELEPVWAKAPNETRAKAAAIAAARLRIMLISFMFLPAATPDRVTATLEQAACR